MFYRCECGEIFHEDEALRSSDFDRSEYSGSVAWARNTFLCCCKCGSEEIQEHEIEDGANDDDAED